jgi:pimeloyl-ACP methyl ester carboxylesterase
VTYPIWSEEAGDPQHPLIALVHRSMDRSAGMLKLSRRLDDRFRVLRYDRRGYGRSAPHAGPFAMDQQVDDLVSLLAGRPAVVVGHSYGGNVALSAAERVPQLVRGVAIYESPQSWEPWWPSDTAGSMAVAVSDRPEEAAERFLRRLLGDAKWESLPDKTRAQRRIEGAAMVGELGDLRAVAPWRADAITVPVVVGFGSRGSDHHRSGMPRVAEALPDADLVELLECRHDAPLSHPDLFCERIVDPLLQRVGRPWSLR